MQTWQEFCKLIINFNLSNNTISYFTILHCLTFNLKVNIISVLKGDNNTIWQ